MASEQDYPIDVDYGPRDKYGVSLARYKEISAAADAEAARQKEASKPLEGVREPDVFDRAVTRRKERDVFDRALERRKAKQALAEGVPSELNAMRGRLGMERSDKPGEPGFAKKAYDFMGGRTGLGGMAGFGIGAALAPSTGFASFLIPALMGGVGAGTGALTEGKNPLKEAAIEGGLDIAIPGGARVIKPVFRLGREAIVKTFAGRAGVSEAAESLLRKWLTPTVKAADLYAAAEATRAIIPYSETERTVKSVLRDEVGRLPLSTQKEIIGMFDEVEKAISSKVIPGKPAVTAPTGLVNAQGQPITRVVQGAQPSRFIPTKRAPVADAMAEVRRLGLEAKRAYKADNSDFGKAINKVRAALLDDLERHGAPEVKQASRAYRKEMAIDELARNLSRPFPSIKIADVARKNPLFKGTFNQTEWEQINRIAKKLETVAPSGGAGILGRTATTIFGSHEAGIPGAVAGWLGPDAIRWLLATPYGRGVTERVLASEIKPSGRTIGVLAKIAEALASGKLSGGEPEQ